MSYKITLGAQIYGFCEKKAGWYERVCYCVSNQIEDMWAIAAPLCNSFNSQDNRTQNWFKSLIQKIEII